MKTTDLYDKIYSGFGADIIRDTVYYNEIKKKKKIYGEEGEDWGEYSKYRTIMNMTLRNARKNLRIKSDACFNGNQMMDMINDIYSPDIAVASIKYNKIIPMIENVIKALHYKLINEFGTKDHAKVAIELFSDLKFVFKNFQTFLQAELHQNFGAKIYARLYKC